MSEAGLPDTNTARLFARADEPAETGDASTLATIAAVQRDGACFVGGARWRGRWVMRLSVIGGDTTEDDAVRSADAIVAAWRSVEGRHRRQDA